MNEKKYRAQQAINYLIHIGLASSQKEIGEMLGYDSESYFSQIISGGKALSDKTLTKLSSISKELNLNWLLTGEGEMLKSGDTYSNVSNTNGVQAIGQPVIHEANVHNTTHNSVPPLFNEEYLQYLEREDIREKQLLTMVLDMAKKNLDELIDWKNKASNRLYDIEQNQSLQLNKQIEQQAELIKMLQYKDEQINHLLSIIKNKNEG